MTDHVEAVLAQWAAERPDLDVSPMAVLGRLSRTSRRVDAELAGTFAAHNLDAASFDVLATLRRAGSPFTLSPKDLAAQSMVTSAAVAQRLNRLEARGLVSRSRNNDDGRGTLVSLTAAGRKLIDGALPDHVATEHRLLEPLTAVERQTLAELLGKLGG
ncbi:MULTISPECIES: MarR family winged helix-turn-helix transcriptional regulator [Arthrobacter]|uniref:MarR family winged helix-turn-helix transcriptional regulator n=1 Tax=Arthrobacter TaxID=1663 RepID=UPI0006DA48BF|nr:MULTISPECIES: MarR family transcriptional regulator [unclassified Arthrobacter]KPN19400.1 MarR family transcriptional regulator [Arthrobacter sp. Edens01]MSR98453.1 MarR family transcriptional regulator [Arthrobacter sp. BL-252-APC-1A]